jgi:hypothetical protein
MAYQRENEAAAKVQDCHDKYPKNSAFLPEMKRKNEAGTTKAADLKALLQRFTEVSICWRLSS